MTDVDAELIERLRISGLRLDRDARWWHEGEPVEHPRLVGALHRWIDRLDDGRFVIRPDDSQYAYIEVEDTPFVVRSVRLEGEQVMIGLSDGTEEELDYGAIWVGDQDALYCRVKGGRFEARLGRNAQFALADRIEEKGSGFFLAAGGQRWPIG